MTEESQQNDDDCEGGDVGMSGCCHRDISLGQTQTEAVEVQRILRTSDLVCKVVIGESQCSLNWILILSG